MEYHWLSPDCDLLPYTHSMKNLSLNVMAYFGFQFCGLPCNIGIRGSYITPTDVAGKNPHEPTTIIQTKKPQLYELEEGPEEIWWVRKYLTLGFCFVCLLSSMAGLTKIFICFLLQFTLFLLKSPSLPKQYHHNTLRLWKKKLAILTSVKQSIRNWTFPFSTYKMTNTYKAHVAACHLLSVLRKMTSTVLAPEPVDWGDPQGRIICAKLKKKTGFYSLGFSLNEYMNSILIHIPYFQHDCGQEKLQIMKHG